MNGEQTIKKPAIRSLHIEGRRWFRKSAGNTYTSVYVYVNGARVYKGGPTGGYGDYCLQMALDWLRAEGWIEQGENYGTMYLRETLGGTYSVIDVGREKDL